jgi:hypothetical protein
MTAIALMICRFALTALSYHADQIRATSTETSA